MMKALKILFIVLLVVAGLAAVGFTALTNALNASASASPAYSTGGSAPMFIACDEEGCPCPGC